MLARILGAAHAAPSVGLMQPWDFIVVRSKETRAQIRESFAQTNSGEEAKLAGTDRAQLYGSLKLEGILEAPVNIAVTCDRTRAGSFVLGRAPMPQTAPYSVCLAIEILWLAARAEGLGVGWVSLLEKDRIARILQLPEEIELIAYLCIGYPQEFSSIPMLEKVGWKKRDAIGPLLFAETAGASPSRFRRRSLRPRRFGPSRMRAFVPLRRKKSTRRPSRRVPWASWKNWRYDSRSIQGTLEPKVDRQRLFVFAGSHGVAARGVSAYPSEVTRQMVLNFLRGGAAINVLARHAGIELHVVDVGVDGEWPGEALASPSFFVRKVRAGTRDLSTGRAMTAEECDQALEAGREQVRLAHRDGVELVGIGEMGIGNTTSASAIYAALFDLKAEKIAGRGTGVTDEISCTRRACSMKRSSCMRRR